ncbi:helix-turn-helix domain-containing protein [Rheinheimera salexigens]|uniref:Regulatory protein n=1 Tax=Rheinheimera salexigens TaxID=1628148 RepID=A0A1E7Q894_9GAMM|nr:hypothetical protein [Rheinheimera salexigens]OEY70357.1 hypothetical protein BI198_12820 [Rheinheimera salexigens]
MHILEQAIESTPNKVSGVAKACGVSVRAVYKWLKAGKLPRTDYTGETEYAKKIANETDGKFSALQILHPNKVTKDRIA